MTRTSELHRGERGASVLLRSLREACGLTQDRWAAFVGVSRKTVQRWESGDAVPDAGAEAAILALCDERQVVGGGRPHAAVPLSATEISEVLVGARAARGRASPAEMTGRDDDLDGAVGRLF